jgi:hypothetical protein
MKTRSLATVVILLCSFLLTPGLAKAQDNDWYQGRQGRWVQEQNAWRFRDRDGDEYRQQGDRWEWARPNVRAVPEQWFQGHRGHWIENPNGGWRFRTVDGRVYRRRQDGSWDWTEARGRDPEGGPGDYR